MSIAYKYRVISTDYGNKVMEVHYSAEGYPDQVISMPLPVNTQTELEVIKSYAPIAFWESLKAEVVQVQVGSTGYVTPDVPLVQEPARAEPVTLTVARLAV